MNQTYSNLKTLANLHEGEKCLSILTTEYQNTGDPIIFSFVFCEYFGYIKRISDNYFYLTESDKASFALEELDKSMRNFDKSKGVKIQTLFSKYYKNRLRAETEMLNYQKRSLNNTADSYDAIMDDIGNEQTDHTSQNEFEKIEFLDYIRNAELTELEVKYCEIIIEDGDKVSSTDIAERLGISCSMITYIKKSLQNKVSTGCLCF